MASSPPLSVTFYSLVTVTIQYLEHPWVIKILLLVFLGNIVSFFF